ncbi:hypothetical protein ACMBCM_09400, partial [Spiroplasma sp. K1]
YYATDEKLLVTDYIRNCNLYSALHGSSLSLSRFRFYLSSLSLSLSLSLFFNSAKENVFLFI